ncbi:NAD(P)H-binding protein [Micromonospora sp. WMMA1998]|uniref:NmrA family NAD(P)-binding protein n=1 Tax=Micromonospora sp. WMMA1998 TaxID=3015167 RepID=UPI00248C93C6|nr:NAD(P)H-binding protein [Micromonospora sp. WMMA1998]WBC16636.1 NAD(P)H-binding protein [Micromonospora sp. WMMA1998]
MRSSQSAEADVTRVLVTGARGKTGLPLAALLGARPGLEVLGGSSDPSTVDIDGVHPTAFSWDEPSGWAAAAADVDAVYVVRPDRADAPQLVAALLSGTSTRTRVVLLSDQDGGDPGPDHPGPAGWAPRVERAVRDSGRPWTVLRPGWFMQVLTDPRFYRDQIAGAGELPFPSGDATVAWIDARDIAAVAARALLDDGHAGRTYRISGPEALSLPHTAELLSAAAGRPVTHRDVTIEEAVAGLEGFERDLSALTFERVRAGGFAEVTDTVERVTGRPARTLRSFLADSEPALRSGGRGGRR